MTFDELLKQNNVNTELMKFVDNDPYKQYDNIVDAYHHVKQFWPDKVNEFTFYDSLVNDLNIKARNSDQLLTVIYRRHPNGDLTEDILDRYVSFKLEDGSTLSIYEFATQRLGRQIITDFHIQKFVEQYNELAKRVNDQASK